MMTRLKRNVRYRAVRYKLAKGSRYSITERRVRRDCDLNPGPSAQESSPLTTRLLRHPVINGAG